MEPNSGNFSSGCPTCFTDLLATDGIALTIGNKYGKGLGNSQKNNFAPRVGFAYQVTPKLVARGGFGIFYNGFENRGFSPNLGENYPFQFNFQFKSADDNHPITYNGCTSPDATPIGSATLETGFSCTPLDPPGQCQRPGLARNSVRLHHTVLHGWQLYPAVSTDAFDVDSGWICDFAGTSSGSLSKLQQRHQYRAPISLRYPCSIPGFRSGRELRDHRRQQLVPLFQTKLEKQFASGLNFLATYTYSKVRSDALDLLNGGSGQGFRAPSVPGFGIHGDYGLAPFDIRNVVHFSGGYELPFGKGKRYMTSILWLSVTHWPAGGASTGAPPFRAVNPLPFLAPRARPMARVAMTSWSRTKPETGTAHRLERRIKLDCGTRELSATLQFGQRCAGSYLGTRLLAVNRPGRSGRSSSND